MGRPVEAFLPRQAAQHYFACDTLDGAGLVGGCQADQSSPQAMIWNMNFSEIAAMHCLERLSLIPALAPVDGFRLARKASRWKSRAAMARLFPIGTRGLCIPRCIPCGLMWVDVGWGCEHRDGAMGGGAMAWRGDVTREQHHSADLRSHSGALGGLA